MGTSPLPKIISNSFASCARLSTKDLALPFLQLCNTTTISTLRLYMPKNLTIVFSTAGLHPSCRRLSYQIRLYSFLRFINNIISSACNISVLQVCLLAGWRGNSFKLPAPTRNGLPSRPWSTGYHYIYLLYCSLYVLNL